MAPPPPRGRAAASPRSAPPPSAGGGDWLCVGVDLGTSGARAAVVDESGEIRASGRRNFESALESRSPRHWLEAVEFAVEEALSAIGEEKAKVKAIAVSATSGTVMGADGADEPLPEAFMYDDPCPDEEIREAIKSHAPPWSPSRGLTGGLGCALELQKRGAARIAHQADWINRRLTGEWAGDASSALKTGFDPMREAWPEWLGEVGLKRELLPRAVRVGSPIGRLSKETAKRFGLKEEVQAIAGTTDGCASFLATGASRLGDAVTALGSTLTVKLMSKRPVFAPQFGVYSHRIGDAWLAGGASNSGGRALAKHFPAERIDALSRQIDPRRETGLDYYPLPSPGERFPMADAQFAGRETPRPDSDAEFLQGLLEGIASVEAKAYETLERLGAPRPERLFTVGGGGANAAWSAIRARKLGFPFERAKSTEAAYGSALLARDGARGSISAG